MKTSTAVAANGTLSFYEFFCGGGMARAGLGPTWNCIFANDFDHRKGESYAANWGADSLRIMDVGRLTVEDLVEPASLVWASFPCQDLSLAGMGAGLKGDRSGTFWPFWRLMERLQDAGREPRVIVLENVCGTLTSHGGRDFEAIANALSGSKYRFGALVLDAVDFLPHSRPRLFVVAVAADVDISPSLQSDECSSYGINNSILRAYNSLGRKSRTHWIWWRVPAPTPRETALKDIVEPAPNDVMWHSEVETSNLLSMMSDVNLKKLRQARSQGGVVYGTMYRRTRLSQDGVKLQRAEVRFDGVAGCLRTPTGGSSRQFLVEVEGRRVRTRLLSAREAARLMGLPDAYTLPKNYNDAYHLVGDGVAVPVVNHLAKRVIEPLLNPNGHDRTT